MRASAREVRYAEQGSAFSIQLLSSDGHRCHAWMELPGLERLSVGAGFTDAIERGDAVL